MAGFAGTDLLPLLQRLTLPWFLLARALLTPVAFGVAAIVEDRDGKVLLVRQSYSAGWLLPGGGVGRGEAPADAIIRELHEEIGLSRSDPPTLIGLYTRKVGLATNVVALYRVTGAIFDFKPNMEIREVVFADPAAPPPGTRDGTLRRLDEISRNATRNPYW